MNERPEPPDAVVDQIRVVPELTQLLLSLEDEANALDERARRVRIEQRRIIQSYFWARGLGSYEPNDWSLSPDDNAFNRMQRPPELKDLIAAAASETPPQEP